MRKKIVVKLGGSSLQNSTTLNELVALVKDLQAKNLDVVIVHGGGPAINQELTARGISWQFINGQRQTTPEMMTVIEDVLANQINSMLVETLKKVDLPAVQMSGAEALLCSQANPELMLVGQIENVNTNVILKHLSNMKIPVIAPIGVGTENEKYNINADWAAAKIAIALNADELIFLTDQNGILDQSKNLISIATPKLIEELIQSEVISGGMYTKVKTMMKALEKGVKKIRVMNASVASQFATLENLGTVLVQDSTQEKKEVTSWTHQAI